MLLLALGGCAGAPRLERFESKRVCMGVQTRIVVYAPDRTAADAAANAAYRRIAELEDAFSDYRPNSELMRLCDRAGEGPAAVSEDLFDILRTGEALARASGGAFDVTVGPMVAQWRAARRSGRLPGPEELARVKSLVGWQLVKLDERARTVELGRPGMRLDLGGIGKGYAAQRAVDTLRAGGLARCLVALAGDIAVGEAPPGRLGWEIGVESGRGASPGRLLLTNAAVSTSGDTEQFIEIDGRRYSHIVDPRTGVGIPGGLSATIVAGRGELADALGTAVCVLGPDAGAELLRQSLGTAAVLDWSGPRGPARRMVEMGRRLEWAGGRR